MIFGMILEAFDFKVSNQIEKILVRTIIFDIPFMFFLSIEFYKNFILK